MLQYILIGAQAAGYGMSIIGNKQQERFVRRADELDKQQRELQFQQETLASLEQADVNLMRLRETMATNRVLASARGQQAGAGSNLMIAQQNVRLFNADERARQLSLSFRKAQLDSVNQLYGMKAQARNIKRRNERFVEGFNMLNFNQLSKNLMEKAGL